MTRAKPNEKLKHTLSLIPPRPGVYQMFAEPGQLLYVGKSVNLKNRVASYFNGTGSLNAAKAQMVGQVKNIEWIETSTEIEALVLETNLIKKFRPKYNILMKDDKNLSYIVIGNGPVSDVYRTRQKPEKGTFFGPYTSGTNINATLRTLRRIFKIRACRMRFANDESGEPIIVAKAGKVPPCMDYYIWLCPAPCLLKTETLAEHSNNTERLKKFLRWQMSEVVSELREKMMLKAKKQEFEEAQKIKEQIEAIDMLGQRQVARDAVKWSYDAIVMLEKYNKYFVGLTTVRSGEIQGVVHTRLEPSLDESPTEIFEHYLAEHYSDEENQHTRILLEQPLVSDVLIQFLCDRSIEVELPEFGAKSDILSFTKTNVMNFAYREEMENLTKKTLTKATMASILEEIGYSVPKEGPISFECYDNSHTNGQFTVASRSVIVNGKSENSLYRKYKLKTLEEDKIDDFESMREIMQRRIVEGFEQENFPTLILIDGGKGQLSSALEWAERGIALLEARLEEWVATVSDVQEEPATEKIIKIDRLKLPYFASLAKREEEVFLPDSEESIRFEHGSAELMLLQKIRDEAHRFAISFNRQMRSKAMKKNILEELPGFGPTTRKKLTKLAGSLDGIKELTEGQILSVCTKTQLQTLKDHGIFGGEG